MATARRYVDDPSDVEDVVQEALVRAWRARDACRSPNDPGGWLATIVRHEAFRRHAGRGAAPAGAMAAAGECAEDDRLDAVLARVDVGSALRALDPLDRRLVALRYGRDLTHPRIAELLGMPEGTVKVRLHRARRALEEALTP
jgi:RNA polymerase sigma-70 factor, ECF subfamily